jgi:DNA-binding HxlR family transcriptional regulator
LEQTIEEAVPAGFHCRRAKTTMEPKLTSTPDGLFCPVRATLALVGQKWVPRIIYELASSTRRFNELANSVGGCNSRTLRDRLVALEELGIVQRTIVTTSPPWVEYALTERGRDLAVALAPLADWGREHLSAETVALAVDAAGIEVAAEGGLAREPQAS